jgi:thymidylate synthase
MLHCVQTMRSSDAWLGYPYDAFNATMLTLYIILLLRNREKKSRHNLSLGTHTLFAGSMHLYEKNWANAERFVEDRDMFSYELSMRFKMDHPNRLLQQLVIGAQHADGVNPRATGWQSL